MFVPSNAIALGPRTTGKVPTAPHVAVVKRHDASALLQTPGASEAIGAMGAMQRLTAGGHTLHGPVAQSALVVQATHPEAALQAPVGAMHVCVAPATQPITASHVLAAL
jgi:hypothetical protein